MRNPNNCLFWKSRVSSVQMCGFEGNNLADLRADFGIFADTKHQELPGSWERNERGRKASTRSHVMYVFLNLNS